MVYPFYFEWRIYLHDYIFMTIRSIEDPLKVFVYGYIYSFL